MLYNLKVQLYSLSSLVQEDIFQRKGLSGKHAFLHYHTLHQGYQKFQRHFYTYGPGLGHEDNLYNASEILFIMEGFLSENVLQLPLSGSWLKREVLYLLIKTSLKLCSGGPSHLTVSLQSLNALSSFGIIFLIDWICPEPCLFSSFNS